MKLLFLTLIASLVVFSCAKQDPTTALTDTPNVELQTPWVEDCSEFIGEWDADSKDPGVQSSVGFDSLHVNDTACWATHVDYEASSSGDFYCIYSYNIVDISGEKITFEVAESSFSGCLEKGDTRECYYEFTYENSLVLNCGKNYDSNFSRVDK